MRALRQAHECTHTHKHARTHTGQPSKALAASPAGPPVIAPSPAVWQIALEGRRLRPLINPSFSRAPSTDAPRKAARQAQPSPGSSSKGRFPRRAPVCRAAPPPAAVFYLRAAVNNSWPRVCFAVKRAAFCPAPPPPPAGRCDLLFTNARPRRVR